MNNTSQTDMGGGTLKMLCRRLESLANITATTEADWRVSIGRELTTAWHVETESYVTLAGGGPDSEEHTLDLPGMTTTTIRRKMLAEGGGCLSVQLIKERRKILADRTARQARQARANTTGE